MHYVTTAPLCHGCKRKRSTCLTVRQRSHSLSGCAELKLEFTSRCDSQIFDGVSGYYFVITKQHIVWINHAINVQKGAFGL